MAGYLGLLFALIRLYYCLGNSAVLASGPWITSDSLYPVHVFTDTVVDGFSFSGWKFSIAPCWFPDLVSTWVMFVVTRNVIAATLVAGFLQVLLLVFGMRLLRKATGASPAPFSDVVTVAAATLVTIWVGSNPAVTYPGFYQFFLPQTHVGSLLVVIYALAAALHLVRSAENGRQPSKAVLAAYVSTCFLGGLSNVMFLIQMLVPLTLALAVAILARALRRASASTPALFGWAAAGSGWAVNRFLLNTTPVSAQGSTTFVRISTAFDTFVRGFFAHLAALDFLHLVALAWLAVCVGVVVSVARRRAADVPSRMSAILFGTLSLSALLSVAAIIVGGTVGLTVFKDYRWALHYLHPTFLLPVIALPFAIGWRYDAAVRARGVLVGGVAVAALGLAFLAATPAPATPATAYVPALVRGLDQLATQEGLRVGVAGYWQARPVTLLSKTGLRAYAVDPVMNPFLWVSNAEWYQPMYASGSPRPDFVVLDDPLWKLDLGAAHARFGGPALRTVNVEGARVLLYRCRTCPPAHWKDAPLTQFVQQFSTSAVSVSAAPGESVIVPVTLRNPGSEVWASAGSRPVTVSYRLYSATGTVLSEGLRTFLPSLVRPGESLDLPVRVSAPDQPGDYRVRVSVVQEAVAWFLDAGAPPLDLPLTVR